MTPNRGRGLIIGALVLLLAWLVAWPLVLTLIGGLRDAGAWSLIHVRAFLDRPTELAALWGSLWIALASVALAAAIGVPLAFFFSRYDFPGRRILGAMVALPAVLPPLVGVLAFMFLFGESGFLAHLVRRIFSLDAAPWKLAGWPAILLVHGYSMFVYFYLFTRAGLASIDASVWEAAASLGASRTRTVTRVVLPLLRPHLVGAALLTFMTSLASFSAPYLFGGGFRVMTTQIVATRLNGDDGLAMVETTALTLVALVALWLLRRTDTDTGAGGSKGTAPARVAFRRPAVRTLITVTGWLVVALLLLPHVTLLLVSLVPAGTWTTEALPPVYTTGNYLTLIRDPVRARPLVNSLWMATAATVASLGIALTAALVASRRRSGGARAIEALLAMPWAVPGTVFAIALAAAFSVDQPLALRFVLVGTLILLPLAYTIRNLPITSRALFAGVRRLDPALGDAAASLGAGRWRSLWRVTLPLLRPSLVAGATLAFVTAFGDFVTSILLYTYDTRPISLEILSSLRQSDVGVAAAYGVVLMLVSTMVFALGAERGSSG
ncbi:MAG TPA: iron ABC transporter permease [Gemmatimonadales bacterium]|nr:iron ABC transporter permease [Gemmatimonadales bacterium]